MITKLRNLWARMRPYYLLVPDEKYVRADFAARQPRHIPAGAPAICVQSSADHLYFGVFGEIATALKQRIPLHVDQYNFRSLRLGESGSLTGAIWTRLVENALSDRKWERLYNAYCDGIAVRSASWLSPLGEIAIWWKARQLWRGIGDKNAFANLSVQGIQIGDLVIDSYIRYKPWPEFRAADPYVFRILRQALREIDKAYRYFGHRKPGLFLTSYTSYVHHGIPARVAIALGIKVISFGSYQQMCKPLSEQDQTHLAEHWNYPARFRDLAPAEQQARSDNADRKLASRMRGEIDNAIGYMRESAYAAGTAEMPNVKGAVIVYLPDFYDSIHVYRWTAFHDYWEWACFTIDTLTEAGIPFLIKSHPNASSDSKRVYDQLRARYPGAAFVPAGITTAQLADAGMAAGVSPRGTVLSELGYLGVPVIAAGDHPHAEFDLAPPPRTIEDYRSRLVGARELPRDAALMRRRACAFYAMHNLLPDPAEIALRDKWLEARAITLTFDTIAARTPQALVAALHELGELPAFIRHIDGWSDEITRSPGAEHAGSAKRSFPVPAQV